MCVTMRLWCARSLLFGRVACVMYVCVCVCVCVCARARARAFACMRGRLSVYLRLRGKCVYITVLRSCVPTRSEREMTNDKKNKRDIQ